jgi:hypothetical protein
MKCAKTGCGADADRGSNFCGNHKPRDSDVVTKSYRITESKEGTRDSSQGSDRKKKDSD